MSNRATHLLDRARSDPDRTAIVWNDEPITFGSLGDDVRGLAATLAGVGIGKASRVGLLIPSSPDFIVAQQALFLLGAVVSPLNVSYRAGEIAHVVSSCGLDHVVTVQALVERLPDAGDHATFLVLDAPADNGGRSIVTLLGREAAAPATVATVAPDDVVMLLNTSATTGKSKGVMLTAANLACNYDRTPEWLGVGGDDVILCALPLYNTFGLNQCINAMLVTGATLVLLPRFDAAACVEAIERHGCTFIPAVPTMLQKILDDERATRAALASVRRVMTGGAPVPAPLLRRLLETTGADTVLLTGYGLTEATALVTLTQVRLDDAGDVERGRTIGRVLDGMEIAIRDEHGRILDGGRIGEIVVRGPNLMRGYHDAPADTAAALRDGWLLSGDLGYVDEEGYAFIVDRKKDVIIRGGQNIYPADIEEVLYGDAGVAEAAVVAAEDDVLGEVAVAYVSLRSGASTSPTDLLRRCREELATYKVPTDVIVLAELPKGPTGKILRRALRNVAAGAGA